MGSDTRFSSNNTTHLRHPYISFYILTYSTICLLSIVAKFRYMLGSVFIISSYGPPHSTMMTSSSMSTVRNAPYISTTDMSLLSCAYIYYVMRTDYRATVGDVASIFCDPLCCFCPSEHVYPLIDPFRFSLMNINDYIKSFFCCLLMSDALIGAKVLLLCICFSYFSTSTSPA